MRTGITSTFITLFLASVLAGCSSSSNSTSSTPNGAAASSNTGSGTGSGTGGTGDTPPCGSIANTPAGTTKPALTPKPIVILTGQRQDSSPVTQLPGQLCLAMEASAQARLPIVLIRLDGSPTIFSTTTFTTTSKNPPSVARDLNAYLYTTIENALALTATHPHVDVLAAIDLAVRTLQGLPGGAGQIYVVGSVLQETGQPDFTNKGMIDADATDVVGTLGALPNLTGDTVTFIGATLTAAPQKKLDIDRATNLTAIWTDIVRKAHGIPHFIEPSRSSTTVPNAAKLPAVTSIPFPPSVVIPWNVHARYPNTGPLRFKPDQAVLVNPPAARTALKDVPAWLQTNLNCSLTITGTTARVGDKNGQKALAKKRADAVKSIITGLSGDGARITTFGLGSYFTGYVLDHDATGQLIPAKAELNRSVFFAPVCSKTTK